MITGLAYTITAAFFGYVVYVFGALFKESRTLGCLLMLFLLIFVAHAGQNYAKSQSAQGQVVEVAK